MKKIWWEAIRDVWDRYWELILVLIGLIPITIYNWWPKEKKYHPVLDLDELGRTA